jgi:retinol dehydrogenase-12
MLTLLPGQGYELQLGTNCIGHFLFTKLLLPILKRTAAFPSTEANSVRVVWTGSLAIDLGGVPGGMDLDDLDGGKGKSQMYYYAQSKCGNLFLGSELANFNSKVSLGKQEEYVLFWRKPKMTYTLVGKLLFCR